MVIPKEEFIYKIQLFYIKIFFFNPEQHTFTGFI